jgi:beta-glucosidase
LKAIRARARGAQVRFVDGSYPSAAAAAAKDADAVVIFATQWMIEGEDAPDMTLPNGQDALIAAVAKANPRTIVVLETGGPVLMPWASKAAGIVEAWYPGSGGGEAIARMLTGEVNPSGHLPISFPVSVAQLPRQTIDGDAQDKAEHPHTDYTIEGAAVGYKWYEKKGAKPAFPFGLGLSYTSFAASDLAAAPEGKGVKVTLTLRNAGSVDGNGLAQIYVAPAAGGWEAPKRLAAFKKIPLKAGESQSVTLSVDPRLLATWDTASHGWKIKGGDYKVMTANSAEDITATATVHVADATLGANGH